MKYRALVAIAAALVGAAPNHAAAQSGSAATAGAVVSRNPPATARRTLLVQLGDRARTRRFVKHALASNETRDRPCLAHESMDAHQQSYAFQGK
jgi:uncharacterized protein YfaQ (DUF2300 family)